MFRGGGGRNGPPEIKSDKGGCFAPRLVHHYLSCTIGSELYSNNYTGMCRPLG